MTERDDMTEPGQETERDKMTDPGEATEPDEMAQHTDRSDDAQPTLRRVFVHALALLGLLLSASGAAGLLRLALAAFGEPELATDTAGGLALGLSLLVVGLPVWLLAWRAAQQQIAADEDETRALPRRLFLVLARAVALIVVVVHAFDVGVWLLGAGPYDAAALARVLVWATVWGYHEHVASELPFGSRGTGRIDRLHVYLAATLGLVLSAGGAGTALTRALERAYDRAFRPEAVLVEGVPGLASAVVAIVLGAALWWWHWGVRARDDRHATGWHVHLFLVGVLGGAATAVVGASRLVYLVLVWLLFAVEEPLVDHFAALPVAVATLAVGSLLWGYHRAVVRERAPSGTWTGPQRLYQHLLVAVGMLTTAAGTAAVVTFGLELLLPDRTLVEAAALERRELATGLTLLLVGVPLWATSWARIERVVQASPRERRSGPRRALIFGAFGLTTLVSVAALGRVLFVTFEALFSQAWSVEVLAAERWSIALLLTAGAISAHYGYVLREDRRAAPPEEPEAAPAALQRVTVLAARPRELARQLTAELQIPVDAWVRHDLPAEPSVLDEEGTVVDLDALSAHLRVLDAPEALVLVSATTWELIPLHRVGARAPS